MNEKTQAAANHIVHTASQLQDLALQADLPFVAHLLRLVMLEAENSAPLLEIAGRLHR